MAYEGKRPGSGKGNNGNQKTFGKSGERRDFGKPGERRDFGKPGERRDFGKPGERRDFGKPGERRDFGKPGERRDFGKPGERRDFGKPGERRDFSKPGEPRGYGKPYEPRGYGKPGEPRTANPPRYPVPPARSIGETPTPPAPASPVPAAPVMPETPENLLVGRNPIREALKSGQSIEKLLIANGELTGSAREIVAMARENRVVIQYVDRARLDAVYPNHQGMLAYASAAEYASVEDILALAQERGEDPFVVVLDGVTDPHNLGAIIRSAECMGAHGVILPERRSAGLNPAAVKASAGALSYVKVARVVNLSRTLNALKDAGVWVTGAAMTGMPTDQVSLTGPIALVIGSEGEGIAPLVEKQCDQLVALKMYGHIESLNASVAAGILLHEIAKARHGGA